MTATQKELREAFKRGIFAAQGPGGWRPNISQDSAETLAKEAYPPKMVARLREVGGRGRGMMTRVLAWLGAGLLLTGMVVTVAVVVWWAVG